MREIKVLSGHLDGADLRRKRRGLSVRCDGTDDNEQIQEAIESASSSKVWFLGEAWERIFGSKKCQD